jgi:hypothetical protein
MTRAGQIKPARSNLTGSTRVRHTVHPWLIAVLSVVLCAGVLSSVVAQESAAPAAGDKSRTYFYRSYNAKTGDLVGESSRRIEPHPDGGYRVFVEWESYPDTSSGTQEYVLDENYSTLSWKVMNAKAKTDYRGERTGEVLTITGTVKGETVSKELKLDALPFYNNPNLGLENFVRSGEEKREFRTLRPDNLKQYKMKASLKDTETITINGEEIEAVKVQWGLTGLKAAFFKQTLWFRKSDGVFMRSQERNDVYGEFYSEE